MGRLSKMWCDLFHGGGHIERDEYGRINWQCKKCGRWSRFPVPLDEEQKSTDRAIAEYRSRTHD